MDGIEVLLCVLGQVVWERQLDARAGQLRWFLLVIDAHRTRRVDPRLDGVPDALARDVDRVRIAQCIRDADDRLQGVTLGTTGGRAVGRLVRGPGLEVQDLTYGLGRYAGAIVRDGDVEQTIVSTAPIAVAGFLCLDLHPDLRGNPVSLGSV